MIAKRSISDRYRADTAHPKFLAVSIDSDPWSVDDLLVVFSEICPTARQKMQIDSVAQSALLRHAREAIRAHLAGERPPAADPAWASGLPRMGVFVTLRKGLALRGCIGIFSAEEDLPTTVARMAIAAARDPRFTDQPITLIELPDLRIELSLLSPLERISDPMDFEIGRHGIYVRAGHAVGCFLPEVATEHGWDKETFLSQCCGQKVGVSGGAWSHDDTEVFRFTVEKIKE